MTISKNHSVCRDLDVFLCVKHHNECYERLTVGVEGAAGALCLVVSGGAGWEGEGTGGWGIVLRERIHMDPFSARAIPFRPSLVSGPDRTEVVFTLAPGGRYLNRDLWRIMSVIARGWGSCKEEKYRNVPQPSPLYHLTLYSLLKLRSGRKYINMSPLYNQLLIYFNIYTVLKLLKIPVSQWLCLIQQ